MSAEHTASPACAYIEDEYGDTIFMAENKQQLIAWATANYQTSPGETYGILDEDGTLIDVGAFTSLIDREAAFEQYDPRDPSGTLGLATHSGADDYGPDDIHF